MVTVVQLHPQNSAAALGPLAEGLAAAEQALLGRALEFAEPMYAGQVLSTGEPTWSHALGLAASLASIGLDAPGRAAGVLFAAPKHLGGVDALRERFGEEIAGLAAGVEKLYQLRVATRGNPHEQNEVLRKMVLGMVEDVRVVLIRLASRTQTLRFFSKNTSPERVSYARETLDIYSPLANRLGVWQLKWELEDLSFRYLEPELYKRIAGLLEDRRSERERFVEQAIGALADELARAGVPAEITGRPKHLYSIYSKMREKSLDFSQIHDVSGLRVLVGETKDCYTALGVVHNLWAPIPREFDDYISRPKANLYRSLHTAVIGPEGRALEVQIRTREMHRDAELGVAAHWRYKERAKHAVLDDTVYVLTPQGKVIDLPQGATPVDFAYALHSDIGHRCRGAKVNGAIVPLDYRLKNAEAVEIITAKTGGPSRDWLNPALGTVKSSRARNKVRQWFNSRRIASVVAAGRAAVEREEVGSRQLQTAVRGGTERTPSPEIPPHRTRAAASSSGILVVGVERLLTQLAHCCKPAPPDQISGFVTKGRGVSVHRRDCTSLARLVERFPERIIGADWGKRGAQAYPVDIVVRGNDRQGLLRDVTETLVREKTNVIAAKTQTRNDIASMYFTVEVEDIDQLQRALQLVDVFDFDGEV